MSKLKSEINTNNHNNAADDLVELSEATIKKLDAAGGRGQGYVRFIFRRSF
ncbi:hypothetical protein [Bartonella tamiae]|uniref:Uncharacterized protein n=1 Tax=Bartonella tamiae Th239 TaxID=1094558 RepID=J1K025_9HYPH|nr:hypothetical protein [Bartonella tamiae]EJF90360.1 hypothetical protein ME5_00761 [Bartonella tamiae Th239]EJF93699.1 hypothetical protein MEG_01123 [Bartonella tamiae Th307]